MSRCHLTMWDTHFCLSADKNICPAWYSLAAISLLCATTFSGCATYQGPRIDPTGEQFIVWPNEPPPALASPPFGAPVSVPPGAATVGPPATVPAPVAAVAPPTVPVAAPLPFGNVQAPPVYSDPGVPTTAAPPGTIPPVQYVPGAGNYALPPATVTPAVPIVAPGAAPPYSGTVPIGREHLRLTPDRLVAPVGTQVVVKAGVCGADGSLIPNERVEWSVARNGIGQLGDMGLHDLSQFFGWWEAPQKLDDWSAVGHTAYMPVTLDIGAPEPTCDLRIERGQSWVTLASCTEGTSLVTARVPSLNEFNQATASVYWIDAQWIFPASVAAEQGRPYVLTTTVLRRTNAAPLAGWVVRYVVGGGGSLGYEGGKSVDVPTDATGRASVEVSPTEAGGGITNVGIIVIRPESVGVNALPRVELARSAATISWGAAVSPTAPATAPPSMPISPSPSSPSPSITGPAPPPQFQQAPTSAAPSNVSPPNTFAQPSSQPVGRPRLELDMRTSNPDQMAVGEYVSYDVTITNRGDGVARHVQITDRFDQGLAHPNDTKNEHVIHNTNLNDIPPNESQRLPRPLTFRIVGVGPQCHDLTVTADDADPVSKRACVTGVPAALEVKISGLHTATVGDVADFNVTVRNTGTTNASGVQLAVQFDAAFEPMFDPGQEPLPNGGVLVRFDRDLVPTEKRPLRVRAKCKQSSQHACAHAAVSAMGNANTVDDWCLEIRPPFSGTVPGATAPP
jgi:uncharacterized repeat protein (TIGR01451 family)